MTSIKRIVAAIDFSVYSEQILKYAAETAKRTSSEIIAVNVINKRFIDSVERAFYDEHPGAFSREKFLNDETGRREKDLEELIKKLVPEKVAFRIFIKNGIPFKEIIKVAEEEKAGLLIVAPKGRTNLPEYLFGSTSKKIFRHSPVSVLSLNAKSELSPP